MRISTKGWIATGTVLGTIALITAVIWSANKEVDQAIQQRRQMMEIARSLTELRLVTFEYILRRHERPRIQEHGASTRLDRLLATTHFPQPEQAGLLRELHARSRTTQRLFEELSPTPVSAGPGDAAILQRFEDQLASRLLIGQQESLADAFALTDYATEQITEARRRVEGFVLAGLALIALMTGSIAWLVNRSVLAPIAKLQQATREVAAGNWSYQLDMASRDEIGEMSRNFDAMTQALRQSFAQVERSNQELATLNKELEAFSYSVSHDLRAPLRSMDGFSLALLEDYADKLDDEGKDALQRIRSASQRMGRLIDELLGLSRVTRAELSLKPVDLSQIAREIASQLQQQEPRRRVHWEIEDGLVVQADRALMQIALQNLIENAWKFTGKTDNPVIRVGRQQREGRSVCFIADNGVGFDMAFADRVFGAFQRLHHEREFSGTGIGLAIVQRVIHRHGGEIEVQARPGQGATFFFSLRKDDHERTGQDHPSG